MKAAFHISINELMTQRWIKKKNRFQIVCKEKLNQNDRQLIKQSPDDKLETKRRMRVSEHKY